MTATCERIHDTVRPLDVWQVIGRVQSGREVLSEIVSFGAGDDEQPLEPVVISRYGVAPWALRVLVLRTN